MDFKRMWMNLKEKVEKEGEERDFYFIDFIDTLLSNMEASDLSRITNCSGKAI